MADNPLKILPIESVPKEGIEDVALDMSYFKLCHQMAELCARTNGIGLSAVQVGKSYKIFVVVLPKKSAEFYLNCEYTPLSEEMIDSMEGCLSITHTQDMRHFLLRRYRKIRVIGKQLTDDGIVDVDKELEGLYSIVFQHEIDHQRGVSVDMLGEEVDLTSAID